MPVLAAGDAATATAAAADGAMRCFFGEIFLAAGCNRLRSFRKSAPKKKETEDKIKKQISENWSTLSGFLFVNCLKIAFKGRHRRQS